MKTKKRILPLAAALLLMLTIIAAAFVTIPVAKAAEATPIDLYLIGGQSNAVGHSVGTSYVDSYDVMYAGEVNRNRLTNEVGHRYIDSVAVYPKAITVGLGRNESCFGPELGMAKILEEEYAGSGKEVLIFKSAAGGTSLLSGDAYSCGNWKSPSTWTSSTIDPTTTYDGAQYKFFVDNLRSTYNNLTAAGYAPTIKSLCWMQGEADMANPAGYRAAFELFASDIRDDIADIIGSSRADVESKVSIIVGEVSSTAGNQDSARIQSFIAMQNQLDDSIENLKVINSSTFATQDGDVWHWGASDMMEIGEMFATAALESDTPEMIEFGTIKDGRVKATLSEDGTTVSLRVIHNSKYKVSSLMVGSSDVTAEIVDGVYSFAITAGETYTVSLTCVPKATYKVDYRFDKSAVRLTGAQTAYEDDRLGFVVTAKTGYEVKSVTATSGEKSLTVEFDAETDTYYVSGHNADVIVTVSSAAAGTQSGETTTPEKSGCGKADASIIFTVIGAIGAALVLKRR